ncbi:hypothetical protein EJB05_24336, partial [Eragrostis curvula]
MLPEEKPTRAASKPTETQKKGEKKVRRPAAPAPAVRVASQGRHECGGDAVTRGSGTGRGQQRSGAAMATTLSLSSPIFLAAAPARAGDGIWHGVASASPSWNTPNVLYKGNRGRVHGQKQRRRMTVVSVWFSDITVLNRTHCKFARRNIVLRVRGLQVMLPHRLFDLVTCFLLSSLEESLRPEKQLSLTLTIDYQLLFLVSSKVRIAGGLAYADNLLAAAPVGLLGLLLLFQNLQLNSWIPLYNSIFSSIKFSIEETTRVRFVFDNEALEVKIGDQLQEGGENVFVGGKNRWKYSTFVNWELWWPQFPILVYFKETQTKPEGQIHFFPVIFNGRQLYDVMVERAGPSKTSGPK